MYETRSPPNNHRHRLTGLAKQKPDAFNYLLLNNITRRVLSRSSHRALFDFQLRGRPTTLNLSTMQPQQPLHQPQPHRTSHPNHKPRHPGEELIEDLFTDVADSIFEINYFKVVSGLGADAAPAKAHRRPHPQ